MEAHPGKTTAAAIKTPVNKTLLTSPVAVMVVSLTLLFDFSILKSKFLNRNGPFKLHEKFTTMNKTNKR
jgi:hypothetical protein